MHHDLTERENRTSGKIHIDPIFSLDEEIRKQEQATIRLKRTRNSYLRVNKFPPEVLGHIFHWNVMPDDAFDGLTKGSHNFLLVCHHWFEVALGTPELWRLWGNTTEDWMRRYSRSDTAQLDLVLDDPGDGGKYFDGTLTNVLRDRASRNTIRRVHLKSKDIQLLNSILSSLTPEGGEVRSNWMESFILWGWEAATVDASDFFARHHFPKLQRLRLTNCIISSWDCLIPGTKALTHLNLAFTHPSSNPTTSQLLSILESNPLLQKISLSWDAVPVDDDHMSICVPLRHLRWLALAGDSRHVLTLLHRLEHPAILDQLDIALYGCTVTEFSETIGPYFKNHFQRRGSSQSGLGLDLKCSDRIVLRVGDVVGADPSCVRLDKVVKFGIRMDQALTGDMREEAIIGLISHLPREELVHLEALDEPVLGGTAAMGDIYAPFPNLGTLYLTGIHLPTAFPGRNHNSNGDDVVLPYLQNLVLDHPEVDNFDWSPLTTFLAGRKPSGEGLDTFKIINSRHMCLEVAESIERMFQKFCVPGDLGSPEECPFRTCGRNATLL